MMSIQRFEFEIDRLPFQPDSSLYVSSRIHIHLLLEIHMIYHKTYILLFVYLYKTLPYQNIWWK